MLKIIACLLMLTDHIGAALIPSVPVLRAIGRLAMPMFAYMVARGYKSTREHGTTKRYVLCMAVLLVISQIPHFMVNGFFAVNIAASWLAAIGVLWILEQKSSFSGICEILLVLVLFCSGLFEYEFLAIAFVVLFYYTKVDRDRPLLRFLGATALLVVYIMAGGGEDEAIALYAIPLIDLITWLEKKYNIDIRPPRYAVYIFYPLHLYILGLIRILSMA